MQHDLQLRAAARVIYDACYPTEDWAPVGFDEAERYATVHYRQAVGAARQARAVLTKRGEQLAEQTSPEMNDRPVSGSGNSVLKGRLWVSTSSSG